MCEMTKYALFLFTAAFCGSVLASSAPPKSLEEELKRLARNAVHEERQAKVEIEMVIFSLQHESVQGVKEPEKKECIQKVKVQALAEGEEMRVQTVGTLSAAVAEAKASSEGKDAEEVLAKLDYKKLKRKVIRQLKALLYDWTPQLEKKFAACLQ